MRGYLALGATALLALAGCGALGDAEVGFGVPRQNQIDEVTAERAPVNGTVVDAGNGCLQRAMEDGSHPWIVWPPNAGPGHADEDFESAVEVEGVEYGDGSPVTGVGALVTLADLPCGSNADSYFGSFGGFCDAAETGVVVLDWLELTGG